MSNGVNFRQLALDLRSELTKCQRLNAELLEALDRLVASTETAKNRMELSISSGALNQARAAITKARGEA